MMSGGNSSSIGGDVANIFQGFFGDAGHPYKAAEKELNDFYNRSTATQNPFYEFGKGNISNYQNWLNSMQNPSQFINNLMGSYQQSPWAKYQTQQAMNAGTNAASASGLTGSTPFAQQMQQNASNISSQDMNNWLQNVLGINTQYGAGLDTSIGRGQNAANALSDLNKDYGSMIAEMQYGKNKAENDQRAQGWGGLFNLGEKAAKAYFGGGF